MANSIFVLFSHIFPLIFAFIGILLIISGVMEDNKSNLGLGLLLFFGAALLPYAILPLII